MEAPAAGLSEAAFRALYEAEFGYVFNSLRRLGVPPRDLEDVAHEAFATAWRRRDTFQAGRPARPWLFGIAFRLASDFRGEARHRREVMGDALDAADEALSPHESAERAEARKAVLKLLATLEMDRRAVFILHEIDGYSVPEISESLSIPLNTAYSRLRLARQDFAQAAQRARASGGLP